MRSSEEVNGTVSTFWKRGDVWLTEGERREKLCGETICRSVEEIFVLIRRERGSGVWIGIERGVVVYR